MVAGPEKPSAGVKTSWLPTIATVPWVGETEAKVTVSGSFSGSLSLASTSIVTGVSNGVSAVSFTASGASFTPPTSTATVAVSVRPLPSETV